MKKIFLSNLALVIFLNALIKPLYTFGIDRGVQNEVGVEAYGLYFALYNFVYLFQFFNDFGIQNFHHSTFSKHPGLLPKYVPKILATKLVMSMGFCVLTLIGALIMGFGPYLWPLSMLIILNQILISLLIYVRTCLSALGYYREDSVISVADKTIMILLMGYFLWISDYPDLNVVFFAGCQTLSLVISMFIALLLMRRRLSLPWKAIRFQWPFARQIWKKSFPYALIFFLMSAYTRIDAVMLERMLPAGKEEAGVYAAAYRILDAFNNLGLLFAGLLLPMFAKLIRTSDKIQEVLDLGRDILLLTGIGITILFYCENQTIMQLLYRDATGYWGEVFQILFLSYPWIMLTYIYSTLLTAGEKVWTMNRLFLFGAIFNFSCNLVLIPLWEAWGAAVSTLVTQAGISIALMILCFRSFHLKWLYRDWSILVFYTILLSGIMSFLSKRFSPGLAGVVFIILTILAALLAFYTLRGRKFQKGPV